MSTRHDGVVRRSLGPVLLGPALLTLTTALALAGCSGTEDEADGPDPSASEGGSPRSPPPAGTPRSHWPLRRPGELVTVQPVSVSKSSAKTSLTALTASAERTTAGAASGSLTWSPASVSALT